MVLVNNKEFQVYTLDTIDSFVNRVAFLLETLPKYVYFENGLPSLEIITQKEANIRVENLLIDIERNAPRTRFSDFYEQNKNRLSGLNILEDVVKPYVAFNSQLSSIGKEYIDVILFEIEENIKSLELINEKFSIEEIWKNRKEIISSLKRRVLENRRDTEEKLKEFARFDKVKKGDIIHSDFRVEKLAFAFELKGFEHHNLLEIFNDIVLTEHVPFASCETFFKILREKVPLKEWAIESDAITLRLHQNKISNSNPDDYTLVLVNIENDNVMVRLQLNINKNSIDEARAMTNIVDIFATNRLTIDNIKQNFISGVFYIANQRMNNYVFSDLVMNNTLFSNILVINENLKTSKKKTGLFVHFNLLSVGNVTANITEKIVTRSDYYQSNMNRDQFAIGTYYVRVKITRTDSVQTSLKFMEMICKLFSIYNEEYASIVKIYREFIPSFAREEIKPTQPIIKEKEQNLRDIAPEIFHANYSRKCIYKPTMISEEDLDQYKNKHVIKFPKDDKVTQPRYYVCNHDKHKYVGLRDNPFDNKNRFPYIPCCYIKNQELIKGSEFRQYYFNEEPIEREVKQQHLFVTDKFVFDGMFGKLPRDLNTLFSSFSTDMKYVYLRKGVKRTPSSFLQCVMEVLGLSRKNIDKVLEERYKMSNENFAASCRQEMYDRTVPEIMNEIINADAYMSPRKYIHGLETYFDCNIFLFTRDSVNGELCVPDHIQAYYKNAIKRRSIFIFEHMGSESDNAKYPQCEIICKWNSENESDVKYIFESDDAEFEGVVDAFNTMSEYYVLTEPLERILFSVNENILCQTIDGYGKTRLLYIQHEGEIITLLTSPLPPFSVQDIDTSVPTLTQPKIALQFIEKTRMRLLGRTKQNDVNSLVCEVGNIRVAIPVVDEELLLSKIKLIQDDIVSVNFSESLLHNHMVAKKYARYTIEYLFWLFSHYLHERKVQYENDAFNVIDDFVAKNIQVKSDFEFQPVSKFFTWTSGVLNDEKLMVTSKEILNRLIFVLRLKIRRNFTELINYRNLKMIETYYTNVFDFTRKWQQIVLDGVGSVNEWIESRHVQYVLYDSVNVFFTEPYFFQNKLVSNRIFLAKNANTLNEALNIALFWKTNNHMLLTTETKPIDLTFTLFAYTSNHEIDQYIVKGEDNTYNIKILGYRIENVSKFAALMDIHK